jgi:large subunit ribosomal protein L4
LWPGGGTTFGPQPRDYSYRLPASARRAALCAALALKLKEESLVVLDKIDVEPAKTKVVAALLDGLGLSSALIITAEENPNLERAASNLPKVKVLRAAGANVYDILNYKHLVLTRDAVEALLGRVSS